MAPRGPGGACHSNARKQGGGWRLVGGFLSPLPPTHFLCSLQFLCPGLFRLSARCLSRGPSLVESLLRFSFSEICSLTPYAAGGTLAPVPGDLLSEPSWLGRGAARRTSVRPSARGADQRGPATGSRRGHRRPGASEASRFLFPCALFLLTRFPQPSASPHHGRGSRPVPRPHQAIASRLARRGVYMRRPRHVWPRRGAGAAWGGSPGPTLVENVQFLFGSLKKCLTPIRHHLTPIRMATLKTE